MSRLSLCPSFSLFLSPPLFSLTYFVNLFSFFSILYTLSISLSFLYFSLNIYLFIVLLAYNKDRTEIVDIWRKPFFSCLHSRYSPITVSNLLDSFLHSHQNFQCLTFSLFSDHILVNFRYNNFYLSFMSMSLLLFLF